MSATDQNIYPNGPASRGDRSHRSNAVVLADVDPREMSAVELCAALDGRCGSVRSARNGRRFASLVSALKSIKKVNPHQHITGSIGGASMLKEVVRVYRADSKAAGRFLDYNESLGFLSSKDRDGFFLQSDDQIVSFLERRIPLDHAPGEFAECDVHLNMVRLAFQSGHPDSLELFRKAYRGVAMENLSDGVFEVWLRTTIGDQGDGAFARAALEGARAAEQESSGTMRVKFLAGMRKDLPDSVLSSSNGAARQPVNPLDFLHHLTDDFGPMIIGVDSVGVDSGWSPEQQESLRHEANGRDLRVAVHFGESWKQGHLPETLERLLDLVANGVLNHLDNANALFAVAEATSAPAYAEGQWSEIREMQRQIFRLLIDRGIALGINPTSNDWLTRSLRKRESWRFRRLDEPVCQDLPPVTELLEGAGRAETLQLVIGNDNGRIYPSRIPGEFLTVSEELANLWGVPGDSGASVYGALPTCAVARLIKNGWELAESVAGGSGPPADQLGGATGLGGAANLRGMAKAGGATQVRGTK